MKAVLLAPAERNYSQVEKEMLPMICGVRKFHKYLWGRHFEIYTSHKLFLDLHKPLLGLLGELNILSQHCPACLQRMALFMQGYDDELVYRH